MQAVSKQCNCKSSYQDALNSLSSHSITSSTFLCNKLCCLFCHLCLCLFYFSSSLAACHLCSVAHQVFISHSPFSIEGTVEEAEQRDKNLNYFVATWLPLRGSLITSVSLSLCLSFSLVFSILPSALLATVLRLFSLIMTSFVLALASQLKHLTLGSHLTFWVAQADAPKMHSHTLTQTQTPCMCVGGGICIFKCRHCVSIRH